MTALVASLHVAFAGLWLGCVLTEALFERALLGRGREQELLLARLHVRVDVFVEIPAMLGVLVTGALLASAAPLTLNTAAMIAIGAVALGANAICVVLVFRRADAAETDDKQRFDRLDDLQHKFGAVVLLAILAAFALGWTEPF